MDSPISREQSSENVAVVEQLLADEALMKEMMEAGGARFGKFGEAMKIFSVIQKVSPQAKDGVLRRLALATSLEHASPVKQNNSPNVKDQIRSRPPREALSALRKSLLGRRTGSRFQKSHRLGDALRREQ